MKKTDLKLKTMLALATIDTKLRIKECLSNGDKQIVYEFLEYHDSDEMNFFLKKYGGRLIHSYYVCNDILTIVLRKLEQ